MTENVLREAMKAKAKSKKDPAFAEIEQELVHKMNWAQMMVQAGRLSKKEYAEFESHLASDFIDAMPTEMYVEMQRDGSFGDLETVARAHDGSRHGDDVRRDRAALNRRITAEALDEALALGKIDSKIYNEEHRNLGAFDDERVRRINDTDDANDGDAVAMDIFFERLVPDQEPAKEPANDGGPKDASED